MITLSRAYFTACNNLSSGRIMKTYEAGNTGVSQAGRIEFPAFNIRTSKGPTHWDLLKDEALTPRTPGGAPKLNIRTSGRISTVRLTTRVCSPTRKLTFL